MDNRFIFSQAFRLGENPDVTALLDALSYVAPTHQLPEADKWNEKALWAMVDTLPLRDFKFEEREMLYIAPSKGFSGIARYRSGYRFTPVSEYCTTDNLCIVASYQYTGQTYAYSDHLANTLIERLMELYSQDTLESHCRNWVETSIYPHFTYKNGDFVYSSQFLHKIALEYTKKRAPVDAKQHIRIYTTICAQIMQGYLSYLRSEKDSKKPATYIASFANWMKSNEVVLSEGKLPDDEIVLLTDDNRIFVQNAIQYAKEISAASTNKLSQQAKSASR